MTRHIRTILAVGLVATTLAVGAAAAGSTVTRDDPLEASLVADSSPTGYTAGGRGFLREAGRFTPVNVPGATGTLPFGINARGQIVGVYDDRDGVSHGFLLNRGRFTTIDHPEAAGVLDGLAGTGLVSINSRGQATGSYVAGDRGRGFVYDRGRFIPIDAPGAVVTSPFGINDRGQITVQALNPDGTEPHYLYERGRFTRIEFPGATRTVVHKINDRGQVVGGYSDAEGLVHGFVFDHGRYTRVDVRGAAVTVVNQLNNRGQSVGYLQRDGDEALHGYVMRNGHVTSFDAPGAETTSAYDINDRGQIVGAGFPTSSLPVT